MRRPSSSVLIGREEHVERIVEAFDDAARGTTTMLLLGGEAGVGKSRFVEHAVGLAGERQMTVLAGGCIEFGGTSIPFAPIREAVRDLAASHGGIEPSDPAWQLTAAFNESGVSTDVTESVGMSRPLGPAQLFEFWLELLRHLGTKAPPLVVIEDTHWADPSTLDLLRFTARNRNHTPFVAIVTFRTDELHRRHPLRPVLAELQRNPAVVRIDLPPLDRTEIGQLVEELRGEPVDQTFIDSVNERSEGNPFYAEELAAAVGADTGSADSLHDVLLARVATVAEGTQEMLRWLSVGGPQVPVQLLERAMEVPEGDQAAQLREAVEHYILVPIEDDRHERYRFRHVLLQEAVYAQLLPGERARTHARLAEVLSAADSEAIDAAQLAQHWLAAHDLPRAIEAAWRAGQQAERMHAYADAFAQFSRVLDVWDQVPDAAERVGADRIAVLDATARAALIGAPDRAPAVMEEALQRAEGHVDNERMALLKEQYGRIAYIAGDGITALASCREALALLADGEPTVARARVLASLGQILMIQLHGAGALEVCEEAVAVARAVGSDQIEAHALNSLGTTNAYLGNLDLAIEQLNMSLELATKAGSFEDVNRAQSNLIDVLCHSGRFDEAVRVGDVTIAYAEEHGLTRWAGAVDLCEVSLALYRSGSWADARAAVVRAERYRSPGVADIVIDSRTALLDVAEGAFEAAEQRLEHLSSLVDRAVEAQLVAPGAEAAADLNLWRDDPYQARIVVAAAMERLPADNPALISRVGPLFSAAVRAEAEIATTARARHDDAEVGEAKRRADEYVKRLEAIREYASQNLPNFAPQADAWFAMCLAERSRLTGDSDVQLWKSAADAFRSVSMPYPEAYAIWRQAEASLTGKGSRAEATQLLREAAAICRRLGAQPLLAEIELLARRARLSIDAVPDESAEAAHPSPLPMGLTAREIEVINLVAAGRTNREIAEVLFITEGTAGAHVSNILGKLGVRGRTEAASVAQRLGLLDPG